MRDWVCSEDSSNVSKLKETAVLFVNIHRGNIQPSWRTNQELRTQKYVVNVHADRFGIDVSQFNRYLWCCTGMNKPTYDNAHVAPWRLHE